MKDTYETPHHSAVRSLHLPPRLLLRLLHIRRTGRFHQSERDAVHPQRQAILLRGHKPLVRMLSWFARANVESGAVWPRIRFTEGPRTREPESARRFGGVIYQAVRQTRDTDGTGCSE